MARLLVGRAVSTIHMCGNSCSGKILERKRNMRLGKMLPVPTSCIKSASGKYMRRLSKMILFKAHCNENPIYVFPQKELSGLSPRLWEHINRSQTRECVNYWDWGRAIPFLGIFISNFLYSLFAVHGETRRPMQNRLCQITTGISW
jgi:hypothetical protein